jgi:outer membrane protein assembly factor BamB
VYALNSTTGEEIWFYPTVGIVNSSPAVNNGEVYVGSEGGLTQGGVMYDLNASNGDPIWTYQTGNAITTSPAVTSQAVYIGSNDGNLYVLNATTGVKLRAFQIDTPTSVALADGLAYVGSSNGNVYAFCALGSLTTINVTNVSSAGTPATCTANVSGANPSGTVSWSSNSSSGTFSSYETTLNSGTSSAVFTDNNPGAVSITACYSGDSNNVASNSTITVNLLNSTLPPTVSLVQSGTENTSITEAFGSQFNVDARMDQSPGIWAYNMYVSWNPNVVQLEDVNEGTFLRQGGNTLFVYSAINNIDGTITSGIGDLLLRVNTVNGSGTLFTLTFQTVGVGNAGITISNQSVISDIEENSIPFTISNGVVTIQPPPIDFYHNGTIDFRDIVYFVTSYIQYYQTGYLNPTCDLNHDGVLNFQDILLFVQDYTSAVQSQTANGS